MKTPTNSKPFAARRAVAVLVTLTAMGLTACEGDNGAMGAAGPAGPAGPTGAAGADGQPGSPAFPAAVYYRSNNGSSNAGTVDRFDQSGSLLSQVTAGNNEGIVLDVAGNLLQAGDATAGSLRTVCRIGERGNGGAFDPTRDRELTGATTGLLNPKGIEIAHTAGYVFLANVNAMQITVFGTGAAGDNAPLAVTPLAANPWDAAYDEVNDRMFVAVTNGTIEVFDSYAANGFTAAADRIITPSDAAGMQISINSHGIVYDRTGDRLIVSDVGSAMDATDGAIFVIDAASSADGNVSVARSISGPATMLGNPVDIVLSGADLRVAEKSNDLILVFANIFDGMSGDVAPDLATASVKPESLVEIVSSAGYPDISDTDDGATVLLGVAVSSNPGAVGPTTGQISRLSTPLNAELASFNAMQSLESVTFDLSGDAYATFDDGSNMAGGIAVTNRLARSRDGETFNLSRDRIITGAATGIVSPKGLDVSTEQGAIFVAENNAATPGILVFSTCTTGDVAPMIRLVPSLAARPWDVDYDAATDRAFVALTNGTVAVFDQVVARLGSGATEINGEDRLIVPASGGVPFAAPTNLHGIDYSYASDSLIVSDVGDAASAIDGKLYVIPAAASADGVTDVTVNIAGVLTNLGNPVDIMFDGADLYVAEKSNGLVMRFDDILNSAGGNVAPDATLAFTAPESVAILPAYLSRMPGE